VNAGATEKYVPFQRVRKSERHTSS